MSGIIHSIFGKKPQRQRRDQRLGQDHHRASTRYSSRVSPRDSKTIFVARDEQGTSDDYENLQRNLHRQQRPPPQQMSSEYGSAEPSPTHFARVVFENTSPDTSDCDSDSDTEALMAEFYEKKYRDQIRQLKKEVKRSRKDVMFYYKFYKEYEKILCKYEILKREVYQLRHVVAKYERAPLVRPTMQSVMSSVGEGAPDQLCSLNDLSISETIDVSRENSTLAMDDVDEVKVFQEFEEGEVEEARDQAVHEIDNCALVRVAVQDECWPDACEVNNSTKPTRFEACAELGPQPVRRALSDSELDRHHSEQSPRPDPKPQMERAPRRSFFRQLDDCSSVCTSEDENIRLISKQLKRHGDCVKYKGRRPDIVREKNRLFKRFGSNERDALAEFEYLHDLSTDVSGFITSPEKSPAPVNCP